MNFENFESFQKDYSIFLGIETEYINFDAVKEEIDEHACINGDVGERFDFEEYSNGKIKLFPFYSEVEETEDGDFVYTYTYEG